MPFFGLPRRKLAGKSYREPLHGFLRFSDQEYVDNFMKHAAVPSKQEYIILKVGFSE